MKKYFIIVIAFITALSCTKEDNDYFSKLGIGAYLTKVSSKTFLDSKDPNATVDLTVGKVGSEVASINVYTAATSTLDKSLWKLIKNVPFTGDSTKLSVTNKEIATALGLTPGDLPPGVVFDLYNEIVTPDGQLFSSINTSSQDLENQVAFNAALRWTGTVVCPFDAGSVAGTYTVVRDDWDDWDPGDEVEVTAGPGPNQVNISLVWPNPDLGVIVTPLVINVDPLTGVVTVPANITFGNYGTFTGGTSTGSSGFVFSCLDKISITVHVLAPPFGDQGFLVLELQK